MAMTVAEFIHKWINGCDTGSGTMHPREMKADLEEMLKETWIKAGIATIKANDGL